MSVEGPIRYPALRAAGHRQDPRRQCCRSGVQSQLHCRKGMDLQGIIGLFCVRIIWFIPLAILCWTGDCRVPNSCRSTSGQVRRRWGRLSPGPRLLRPASSSSTSLTALHRGELGLRTWREGRKSRFILQVRFLTNIFWYIAAPSTKCTIVNKSILFDFCPSSARRFSFQERPR